MNHRFALAVILGFSAFLGAIVLFFAGEVTADNVLNESTRGRFSTPRPQAPLDHGPSALFPRNKSPNKQYPSFKGGIAEDGVGINQTGDMEGVDALSRGAVPTWKLGSGARLISGDVVELDDGRFLRRAIVSTRRDARGNENLVLFIETFDKMRGAVGQSYFDAERISVQTRARSHSIVLGLLQRSCHREVLGSRAREDGGGEIWLDAPAHAAGIFGFLQHVQDLVGNYAKAELVEL